MKAGSNLTLGWREWLALPELGISSIKAKVDTGARSSSLHAESIQITEKDGRRWVSFDLEPTSNVLVRTQARVKLPLYDVRWITSSNGSRQKRPIVRTTIELSGHSWTMDLSLGPRGSMGFPMLLGREAMRKRFLVDPARSFLAKDHIPKERVARRMKAK